MVNSGFRSARLTVLSLFLATVCAGCTNHTDLIEARRELFEWGTIQHNATLLSPAEDHLEENLTPINLKRYELRDDPVVQLIPRTVDPEIVDSPTYNEYFAILNPPECSIWAVPLPDYCPVHADIKVPVTDSHTVPAKNYAMISHAAQSTYDGQEYLLSFLDFQRFARETGDIIRIVSPADGIFTLAHLLHASQPLEEDWDDVYVGLTVIRQSRPNSQAEWFNNRDSNQKYDPRYLKKTEVFQVRKDGRWDAVINPPNPKCVSVKSNVPLAPEDDFSVNPYANISCSTGAGDNGTFMQCSTHMRTYLSAQHNDMVVFQVSYGKSWFTVNDDCVALGAAKVGPVLITSDCKDNCPTVVLPAPENQAPGNPQPTQPTPVDSEPVCTDKDVSADRSTLLTKGNKIYRTVLKSARTFMKSAEETGKAKRKARQLLSQVRGLGTTISSFSAEIPVQVKNCTGESEKCLLHDNSASIYGIQETTVELQNSLKKIHKGIKKNFTASRFSNISALGVLLDSELKKELQQVQQLQKEFDSAATSLPVMDFVCSE